MKKTFFTILCVLCVTAFFTTACSSSSDSDPDYSGTWIHEDSTNGTITLTVKPDGTFTMNVTGTYSNTLGNSSTGKWEVIKNHIITAKMDTDGSAPLTINGIIETDTKMHLDMPFPSATEPTPLTFNKK